MSATITDLEAIGEPVRMREPPVATLEVRFRTRERGKHECSYEKQGPTEWVAIIRRKA
jgi:hypothetical protein